MTNCVKKIVGLLLIVVALVACATIEDSDFFTPQTTNDYLLDAYGGDSDFTLPGKFNIDITKISKFNFNSFDGSSQASIQGIYIGDLTEIQNRKIIIYLHDKHGNLDTNWSRIKLLANLGLDQYSILAIDYRGYGLSTGSPTEQGIYADSDYALRWLEEKGVLAENIIIYGYGLGAAAAIELAQNPRSLSPDKIIIESPFASIEALIQNDLLQSIPGTFLSNLSFNNADKIKNVSQPLLWLHGTQDNVYDLESQGKVVFDAHPGVVNQGKFFYQVANANHRNLPEKFINSFDGYLIALHNFIQSG